MGLTIGLVGIFFAAMMAILYFGYEQAEKDRADRASSEARRDLAHQEGRLDGRTADEVVFDIEHRIDADLQDVASMLRRAASHPHRA